MIPLIDFLFVDIFQKMSQIPIPTSDLSDIDKVNNKSFFIYFKLIYTSIEIDSTFLFSNKNHPYFNDFLKYLIAHFETNVDRNCKKVLAHIFKDMFIDFSGLKL
jgi:hypothetical protein